MLKKIICLKQLNGMWCFPICRWTLLLRHQSRYISNYFNLKVTQGRNWQKHKLQAPH